MKLQPQNNYVLCKLIEKDKQQVNEGIVYDKPQVPVYEVVSIRQCQESLDDFRLSLGDKVICNSTGTKAILEDSEYYLFNIENIIGKIQ